MSRTSNIKVMNDNLDIFSKGHYFIGNKRINVDIPSIEGNTTLIGLDYKPVRVYQHNPTTIEITNETTISLILRLIGDNVKDIGVLNFASGKNQAVDALKDPWLKKKAPCTQHVYMSRLKVVQNCTIITKPPTVFTLTI